MFDGINTAKTSLSSLPQKNSASAVRSIPKNPASHPRESASIRGSFSSKLCALGVLALNLFLPLHHSGLVVQRTADDEDVCLHHLLIAGDSRTIRRQRFTLADAGILRQCLDHLRV
jgi:hypothetical protein